MEVPKKPDEKKRNKTKQNKKKQNKTKQNKQTKNSKENGQFCQIQVQPIAVRKQNVS